MVMTTFDVVKGLNLAGAFDEANSGLMVANFSYISLSLMDGLLSL